MDPPLKRKRIKHVVPLGSIFVWTMESVIMVGMLFTGTLFISAGVASTDIWKINILDSAVSFSMALSSILAMFGHFFIAHAFNRESMASFAGGLHSGFSNAHCTMCFICFGTYLVLYIDSCLLGLPSKDMCTLFFRNTPFVEIVTGVFSAFILIIFLASLALSFVSSPQDTPSYAFISKGTLLMSATLFGWVGPIGRSGFARYGCPTPSPTPTLLGFEPLATGMILMGASAGMGIASMVTEWVVGGIYHPKATWKEIVPHIVIDFLVFVVSIGVSAPLLFGRNDVGSMGVGMCLGVSGGVAIWSIVDFTMGLVFVSGCWKPWQSQQRQQEEPTVGYPPSSATEPNPSNTATMITPPDMKMYMSDFPNPGTMKKADSLPPSLRATNSDSMANMFVQDDVRRSLRQRAPPLFGGNS